MADSKALCLRIQFQTGEQRTDKNETQLQTCCVSSGTVRARYCWLPLAVSGANPGMKKCKRGKGTIFTASLRRSAFNWPGNLRHVVTPDIVICRKLKQFFVADGLDCAVPSLFKLYGNISSGVLDRDLEGDSHCVFGRTFPIIWGQQWNDIGRKNLLWRKPVTQPQF